MLSFQTEILNGVDERLETLKRGLSFNAHNNNDRDINFDSTECLELDKNNIPKYVNGKYEAFVYAEEGEQVKKFWHVPSNFVFPKVTRYEGWKFWLLGMPDHHEKLTEGTTRSHPIMPFRYFDDKLLPKIPKNALRVNWWPVYKIMDEAITMDNLNPTDISSEQVDTWYRAGTDILKSRVSYCFSKTKHHLWTVSYWSKKVSPSQIRKFGTDDDKLALPSPKSMQTQKSRTSKGRKRPLKENNCHPRRLQIRRTSPESDELSLIPQYGCENHNISETSTSSKESDCNADGITLEQQKDLIEHSPYTCNDIDSAVRYFLRHLTQRQENSEGEDVIPTEREKLALKHKVASERKTS